MTTDEAVAHAIRTVFSKFDELGAARQVLIWWRGKGLRFPVRRMELRSHPVAWVECDYRMIRQTLQHPIYAGVYAFGKSKTVRELDPEDPTKLLVRRQILPLEQWRVLIQDHHEAYITFEKFLQNRKRLQSNANMSSPSKEDEATSRGSAIIALNGLGVWSTLQDIPASVGKTYHVNPKRALEYQKGVERQHKLYDLIVGHDAEIAVRLKQPPSEIR